MILGFSIGFLEIQWIDIFDVFVVTLLLYNVYKLIRGSMAIRVFFGFLSLYLIYVIVQAANMELVSSILGQFMGVGVLALIILFQQEIRRFLLMIAKTTSLQEGNIMKNLRTVWSQSGDFQRTEVGQIIEALKSLSATHTGALIVISRNSELKFYAETGDRVEGIISKRLLEAIFNKNSPLHDGAVIIFKNRIIAARCILPVTERDDIPANMGLRHRAAIGMSENTDVLILVVSEETGNISIIRSGLINTGLATKELKQSIMEYLEEDDMPTGLFRKKKKLTKSNG